MRKNTLMGLCWTALLALVLFLSSAPGVSAADLCVKPAGADGCYATIQAAIDAAAPGDTINVYPGDYNETATGRSILDSAVYTFGLFIDKDNLTIQGVDASGTPVSDYNAVAASVTTNATNNFGYSGTFVKADGVTIRGLELLPNIPGDNKTVEVIGDDFTLQYSNVNVPGGGSIYLNDWRYDPVTKVSHLESYHILNNKFSDGASLDISSGAGYSGSVTGRVIEGNYFDAGLANWALVSFNGYVETIGWFKDPVGGAIIQGNTFTGTEQYIRMRGALDDTVKAQFDWQSYYEDNTFPYVAAAWTPGGEIRAYSYTSGTYLIPEARRISGTVQGEIDHAAAGDTVKVGGTFTTTTMINLNKDVTVEGDGTAIFQVSGGGYIFNITGAGSTLKNVEIYKTDKLSQNIILVNASNVTIQGNLVHGQYVLGDGEVARAMEVAGGLTGLLFDGNTIYGLRQPAYMNKSTGVISNNNVYGTRGWVVDGAMMTFTGNTWGDATHFNAYDIAILNAASPDPAYATFYNLPAVSAANNRAIIEDQRVTPSVLSVVYVDAAAPIVGEGTLYKPYQTIAEALPRVVEGGAVYIKNGAYTLPMPFTINKGATFEGESQAGVVVTPSGTIYDYFVMITAPNVTLKNMTLDGNVPHYTAWPPSKPFYGINISQVAGENNVKLENVTVQEFGKTGFNFNNAKSLTLNNLTSKDNGGAGVFLSNAYRVTFNGLTTSNNQWGGVAVAIINKNSPTPTYGTDDIVFTGAITLGESAGYQGGVYFEEEYYNATDPGVITYSIDGSDANVKFPAGLFGYKLSGPQDDAPTRRVRFYDTYAHAEAAAFHPDDALHIVGPGHFLMDGRTLTDLATGLNSMDRLSDGESVVLNPDSDGDNEIVATYDGTGTADVKLWKYASNPHNTLPNFAAPGTFYDIQVLNSTDPNATLTVVMEVETGKVLRYWDGSRWVVVRSNDGSIAKGDGTGHITIVFGPGSTPKLSELTGTPVVSSSPEAIAVQLSADTVQQKQTVTAQIVGKSTSLYGVQVFLTFDATRLAVTGVTLGNGLSADNIALNNYNNTTGTISFAYTQVAPSQPVEGDNILLATVTFQARATAPSGAAVVGYATSEQTIFADANGMALGILPTTLDGQTDSVTVQPETTVSGVVTMQGRTNHAGVSVTLDQVPGPYLNTVTTGSGGTYLFNGLVTGTYDLEASFPGYLTAKLLNKVLSATGYTVPTVELLGGDATHNQAIDINDLSHIGAWFLKVLTGEGLTADINGDGSANILDLVMAGSNFGKTATPWTWVP